QSFSNQVSRERSCPVWRHPNLRPINPPAEDDFKELPKSVVTMASSGPGVPHNDESESSESEGYASEAQATSDMDVHSATSEEEDREEEEGEIAATRTSLYRLAAQIHDLADIVEYNAIFADPRVLSLLQKRASSVLTLYRSVHEKENRINSLKEANLPTFTPRFSDIILIRPKSHIAAFKASHEYL
ncbi:hypothetical protein CPB86DRAFT_852445, partial [Serendipita vermifera]